MTRSRHATRRPRSSSAACSATRAAGAKPVIPAAEYLARLYRRPGAARDFDGVAPHPYAGTVKEMAAQVRLLHREIDRAGDNASLWITEVGWASGGPPSSLNPGPEGQADRLTKAYDYFLDRRRKLRIKTVDWYSWRDGPDTGPAAAAPGAGSPACWPRTALRSRR